jgi:hypothetical protein
MPNKVYDERELTLQDDTDIVVRPLTIGRLRRFMNAWKDFENIAEDDPVASFDIFVNCSGVAIEHEFKEQFPETKGKGKVVLNEAYKAYLEEVLDIETIYVIFDVAAGMKLNDPNLLAAAAQAAASGTN